jgi:phosphoribosylformylglycinamidine cyclo-ligase
MGQRVTPPPPSESQGLPALLRWVERTRDLHPGATPALSLGYFANVVPISADQGIAISTDGVGTKILVAEAVGKYDTVGIDCVAMNANDILCVGATPVSLVDYIAVQEEKPDLLEAIARGLYRGCELARINVPGGELARVPEMLRGHRDGYAFDLVGTCIGVVPMSSIIAGDRVQPGDVLLGLESSGLHSNGYTLARRVLIESMGLDYDTHVEELGTTLGEELLRPTRIYVPEIVELLDSDVDVHAMAHMTGGGLWNLVRTQAAVGFRIESWPEPGAIFQLLQQAGRVADETAFCEFNMGIGFCVIVPEADVDRARALLTRTDAPVHVLGTVTADAERSISFPARGLAGTRGEFRRA